jgi:hypothetical protein
MPSSVPARPRSTTPQPPDYPEHIGFLLAEEDALMEMLKACVTLPDRTGKEQPVRVWFRLPDPETTVTYPYITIDLVGINPAYDLWHSEYPLYIDSEVEEDSNTGQVTGYRLYDPSTSPRIVAADPPLFFLRRNYLQYRLIFQLGLWANNIAHDRIMTARMFRDVIQPHPSWLHCPADGVWKRIEPMGWTPADIPTQEGAQKRIFRKIFTISVQTDLPQDRLVELSQQPRIQKLLLHMEDRDTSYQVVPDDQSQYWFTLHDYAAEEAP